MIKVCEIFAGVGGFRLGLKRTSDNFNFVWANLCTNERMTERNKQYIFDCYTSHFGIQNNVNLLDIREVKKNIYKIMIY